MLPERYVIRAGERSYVALLETEDYRPLRREMLPDVSIAETKPGKRRSRSKGSAAVVAKGGVIMQALVKAEYREAFLEIRQADPEHKLVTGIELLSPSNKRPHSKGWRLYCRKRQAFLRGHANFVEIDLVRRGKRLPIVDDWPDSPYYLLVCRKPEAPRCTVWPAFFTEVLPTLSIPLAPPDADLSLELQPLINAIYTRSRYARDIDYTKTITPPLAPADAAWLDNRLRGQRSRA